MTSRCPICRAPDCRAESCAEEIGLRASGVAHESVNIPLPPIPRSPRRRVADAIREVWDDLAARDTDGALRRLLTATDELPRLREHVAAAERSAIECEVWTLAVDSARVALRLDQFERCETFLRLAEGLWSGDSLGQVASTREALERSRRLAALCSGAA